MNAITIGLDIAKSVFQVHGEDASGRVVLQKRLRRSQVEALFAKLPGCRVGIEACGTSHYWGRVLQGLGHEVRLVPPGHVTPFVRRNKTDARDAAAICVALQRPDMGFVPVKSEAQQAMRSLERARDLLVRQHTQLCNSLRSLLAEFGVVARPGRKGVSELEALVAAGDERLPAGLLTTLRGMMGVIAGMRGEIERQETRIVATARHDPTMRRLATIPGIGPILAHAVVTAAGDGQRFRSARDFAAWAGLTPRQRNSGGTHRQVGISKQGDTRLRALFTLGASSVLRQVRGRNDRGTAWQRGILTRRPIKVAVVAQAARNARIAWAVLTSGQAYRPDHAANLAAAA